MAKKKKHFSAKTDEDGIVYSTNPNFSAFAGLADLLDDKETSGQQTLEVHLEKKHRGGKAAMIIKGFASSDEDLNELAKKLKTGMGVGGSAKDGEIIIQGDRREKLMEILNKLGYKTKRVGG
jgi:translation initiation factor 1